jgi:hypothetical protein
MVTIPRSVPLHEETAMMSARRAPGLNRSIRPVWLLALPLALYACSEPPTTYEAIDPTLEHARQALSVTAADPAEGSRGQTLEVRVVGSGFAKGAVASWERGGVADPDVVVLSTDYVSKSELRALIVIDADAATEHYDIAVTNPDKKKGIGSELFKVQEPVDPGLPAEAVPMPAGTSKGFSTQSSETGWVLLEVTSASGDQIYLWDGASESPVFVTAKTSVSPAFLDAEGNVFHDGKVYLRAGDMWSAVDLPLPSGFHSASVRASSDYGWVTGRAQSDAGIWELIRWRPLGGAVWEPEVLPAWPAEPGWTVVVHSARDINNHGQIAGYRTVQKQTKGKTETVVEPWTWRGTGQDIEPLSIYEPRPTGAFATAINDQGVIAGYGNSDPRAILRWLPGADGYQAPEMLGDIYGTAGVRAIDQCGRIVANTITASYQGWGLNTAFVLDPATGVRVQAAPLPGLLSSIASDINTSGRLAGYSHHPESGAQLPSVWEVGPCSPD